MQEFLPLVPINHHSTQFEILTALLNKQKKTDNVKPAYKENARDQNFFCYRQALFHIFWILQTPDSWDYNNFPLKTGFHHAQLPFNIGFTIQCAVFQKHWALNRCKQSFKIQNHLNSPIFRHTYYIKDELFIQVQLF